MIPLHGNIIARHYGRQLQFKHLKDYAKAKDLVIHRAVDSLLIEHNNSLAVCLRSGVAVIWGKMEDFKFFNKQKDAFFDQTFDTIYEQRYGYVLNEAVFSIEEDCIRLPKYDQKIIVSISHAIARSVQLEYNEDIIAKTLEQIVDFPQQLQKYGKISLSNRKIKRLIGVLVEAQHGLSTFGLAKDFPELLWEEPQYESYYRNTANYLELHDRWQVLSEKMSALGSSLDLLRDESNTKQSHRLEWVIIILIVIEIIFYLIETLASKL